jgi:fructose-1-phosphate kinase PfkB-like protein
MTSSTIIVGLNGALQKRFILPDKAVLVPGNVHRAKDVQIGLGGKGQDVAISLDCLGYEGSSQLAQFVGSGASGDMVFDLLLEKLGEPAMALTVRTLSSMRTCTSIVASDATTELVEPSGVISTEDMAELMTKLEKVSDPPAAAICIMGSMPPGPGCTDDIYAEIYRRVAGPSSLCVVDSVVGSEYLLRAMAGMEKPGPAIFKMNASELCKLAGITKSGNEADGVLPEELTVAISEFLKKYSPFALKALKAVAITDGKHPAYFAAFNDQGFQLYKVPVPVLDSEALLFPIGAGDSVAAGMLAAWRCLAERSSDYSVLSSDLTNALTEHVDANGLETQDESVCSMISAFAFGLACGSASCLQEENSVLQTDDVLNLFKSAGRPAFLMKQEI